jgi:hypothetical protein
MQHPDDAARTASDLLDWLVDLAKAHLVCPSTQDIARRLQVGTTDAAMAFERLRADGLIDWTVKHCGSPHGRVRAVTILATGEATLLPDECDWARPVCDPDLEAAKEILRRKGRVVFAAEVVDGRRSRGLVKVDHLRLDRVDVIAMAAAVRF